MREIGQYLVDLYSLFLKEENIVGKVKQAFSNGFLCLPSFGFSTFVCVASFSEKDFDESINTLGNYMLLNYNAPSEHEAKRVAKNGFNFYVRHL